MNYLTLDDVLAIRDQVEAQYHNTFDIRTPNALMTALDAPRRAVFGQEMFPTLGEKAGALLYALIQNHPFWDGNKRVATSALRLFLERNNARLVISDTHLRTYAREIARGTLQRDDVVRWVGRFLEDKT